MISKRGCFKEGEASLKLETPVPQIEATPESSPEEVPSKTNPNRRSDRHANEVPD